MDLNSTIAIPHARFHRTFVLCLFLLNQIQFSQLASSLTELIYLLLTSAYPSKEWIYNPLITLHLVSPILPSPILLASL
jgi:hypothetical protein